MEKEAVETVTLVSGCFSTNFCGLGLIIPCLAKQQVLGIDQASDTQVL